MENKLTAKQENKYYVYHLVDPRDNSVFYVGKGCGDRINQHVKNARADRVDNAAKYRRIKSIIADGLDVITVKIKEGLTEKEALSLERNLIAEKKPSLTNDLHGSGQRVKEQARVMLKNMPPFNLWERYGNPLTMEAFRSVFGSNRKAYDFICGTLSEVANG